MSATSASRLLRSSGLDWVPEIPAHWQVLPSWAIARHVRRPPTPEQGVVTAFRDGQVTLRSNRRMEGFTEAIQEYGYQGVLRGELVIHSMDGFAGAIGVSDSDGKMSPVAHIYSVPRGEARYFALLLRVMASGGYVESLAKGIRERSTAFDRAAFKAISLPVPPLEEQRMILGYLDRETARIDAFIAKNEELIALLAERRVSLVAQAIYAEPHPRVQLRHVGRVVNGGTPPSGDAQCWDGDIPFVTPPDLNGLDGRLLSDTQRSITAVGLTHAGLAPAGSVILSTRAPIGHVASTDREVAFNQGCRAIVPAPGVRQDFLALALIASRADMDARGLGTTFTELSGNSLAALRLPLPDTQRQEEIARDSRQAIERIEAAIQTARRSVELGRERRAALISAAVTGKIDLGVES